MEFETNFKTVLAWAIPIPLKVIGYPVRLIQRAVRKILMRNPKWRQAV